MPDERMNGMEWNGLSPRGGVGFWVFESWEGRMGGWVAVFGIVGGRGAGRVGDEVR